MAALAGPPVARMLAASMLVILSRAFRIVANDTTALHQGEFHHTMFAQWKTRKRRFIGQNSRENARTATTFCCVMCLISLPQSSRNEQAMAFPIRRSQGVNLSTTTFITGCGSTFLALTSHLQGSCDRLVTWARPDPLKTELLEQQIHWNIALHLRQQRI